MPPQRPHIVPPQAAGKHVLPNGIRVRLALATVINDLFSRQPRVQAAAASPSSSRSVSAAPSSTPSSTHLSWLPQSLVPLLSVSSAAATVSISSPPHLVRFSCAYKDTDPSYREPGIESDSPTAVSCATQLARSRHVRSRRRSKPHSLTLVSSLRAPPTPRMRDLHHSGSYPTSTHT
jgi:hypothetical protein